MSTPRGKSGFSSIEVAGMDNLVQKLNKLDAKSKTVVERTVNDFKTRAPAWVSAAVAEEYAIKKSEVKEAFTGARKGIGSINVKGLTVSNVQLIYRGRLLTPVHFRMKPTRPPTKRQENAQLIPGKGIKGSEPVGRVATIRPLVPYQITAEIKKGRRIRMPPGVFLGTNKGAGYIPFQRVRESRMPIVSIKTVSIPQMISNEAVQKRISENIEQGLRKRLEHHLSQQFSKN